MRFSEQTPRMQPRNGERVPINIHPETRDRLNAFLVSGPGATTGIGFSEFIDLSMRLWEGIELAPEAPNNLPSDTRLPGEPLIKRSVAVVICVRDPDASNDFTQYGDAHVAIYDVDLGGMDLEDPVEFLDWADGREEDAVALEQAGWQGAADYIRSIVDQQREELDPKELARANAARANDERYENGNYIID